MVSYNGRRYYGALRRTLRNPSKESPIKALDRIPLKKETSNYYLNSGRAGIETFKKPFWSLKNGLNPAIPGELYSQLRSKCESFTRTDEVPPNCFC